MPVLKVAWPHRQDPARAREAVDALARELEERLQAVCAWDADTLRFTAPGASGTVLLESAAVAVEVRLGIALWPLRGRIEDGIRSRLQEALG